jgi:uncharacterized repeat protein (TIGR01451 family)/fimbrial isopeptide formation D2 family protein
MSILFLVSSSSPWAAERLTPDRETIKSTNADLRNNLTQKSPRPLTASYPLNKFIDPESTDISLPSAAAVFTKNQVLWAAQSPATIPWDYDVTGGPPSPSVITIGTPVHIVYGIQVTSSNASSSPISLKITLPAGFTPTSQRCAKFVGGGHSGTVAPACALSSLPIFSIGALNGGDDKVIVTIDGYFNQAGAFSVAFDATRDATTESTSLNMSADVLNLPVDISVTKEVKLKTGGAFSPSTSTPFGGTVIYKLTVKNESVPDPINHSTDLYLGPLLHLQDTLSAPNTNGVALTISAQTFSCSSTTGADCPTVPTGALPPITLGVGNSQNLAFNYPVASNGFLPAAGSFEITFEATISTNATCSNAPNNELRNSAHFTYSNGNKTITDTLPANNTSNPTIVTLTGSFPQCTTTTVPGISVSKKLLSPATPVWGVPFTYEITITNTSSQTLVGLSLNDFVRGLGTPPFTATFNAGGANPVCTPACIPPAPTSSAPLVSGGFSFLFSVNFASLNPGAVQTVQYQVQYDTSCATSIVAGSINNRAQLNGSATGFFDLTTPMPALSLCELTVDKKQTSGPTSFASFPVTLGYKVEFKNTSASQTIKVGTLVDAMALDSATYGVNLPIDYSYSCTATSVTMPGAAILTKPSTAANLQFNNPLRVGVRLINFQGLGNAVFLPGGILSCDLSVTLKQPPTNDSLCQGAGTPNVVNTAFADLAPGFNAFSQPAFEDSVITPLAKCVSILVRKKVAPNVVAGGTVTFTLSVENVGNDPISNITLNDNVPSDFTNVAWTCASGCSTLSGSGNNISIPLTSLPGGATTTVLVTATAPTILGSYCNSTNATFNPFPALTYFEGNQNDLTQASACVQVKSPEPTNPTLTKLFDPVQISTNGTSTLTFNITNTNGDPKQTGISFSDTLPAGLQIVSVVANGCSGTPTISTDGRTITLTGGSLVGANADGSGKHSCQISVNVKATGVCGVFTNNKNNFSNVTNLDVSGVSQQLEVTSCPPPTESCSVKTEEISCKADGKGGYLYTFTVTNNTGHVVTDILLTPPANSNFTLSDKQFSLLPAGLANGASITLQVTINGGQPQQQACFDVTLMTRDGECCTKRVCPVLPDCCGIAKDESIECNQDGTYTYTMSIVNTGVNTIQHIYLYPPPGVTMTPNYFQVSLKPGETFTTKVTIKGGKPGDKLCFDISLHTANMENCCKGQHCIVLPECPVRGKR